MKPLIRKVISWTLVHLQVLELLILMNRVLGRRVMILGLHRVKDPLRDAGNTGLINLYISESNLESLIHYLRRRFRIISMNDYLENSSNSLGIRDDCAVLTFDDVYEDFATGAVPILEREKASGTLFVASGRNSSAMPAWWDLAYHLLSRLTSEHRQAVVSDLEGLVDKGYLSGNLFASHENGTGIKHMAIVSLIRELQTYSEDQRLEVIGRLTNVVPVDMERFKRANRFVTDTELADLSSTDIDVEAHTVSHSFLTELTDEEIKRELLVSKEQLEKLLGKNIVGFAYPGGRHSPNVRRLVEQCGYRYAVTIDFGLNSHSSDPFELKRIMVSDDVLTDANRNFDEKAFAWLYLKATLAR